MDVFRGHAVIRTLALGVSVVMLVGLIGPVGCSKNQESEEPQPPSGETGDPGVLAQQFVEMLAAGEYAAAAATFDDKMKEALPQAKLQEIWEGLQAKEQAGPFVRQVSIRTERSGDYRVVFVTCEFKNAPIDVKVVYDADGKVAGLFFQPGTQTSYEAPDYVTAEAFSEREVTFGLPDWPLPATLTVPDGKDPFPAVILVHGSGAHDRDESLGPNKPFRDLAWGLASQGVAVFRYEKRTKEHAARTAQQADTFTVEKETVADAAEAVRCLRQVKEVDPGKIFVLGHSLGGTLAPRIAQRAPAAAGLIILAGATRPLEDVVIDQVSYLSNLDGQVSDEEQAAIAQLEEQATRVKDPSLSAQTPSPELPLGLPASYWLDLRDYSPAEAAREVERPMLILQGGRDYQVTAEDFAGWKEALSGRDDVSFLWYEDLNHLFIEGQGPCTPAEYLTVGHVSFRVVRDIADWVKER